MNARRFTFSYMARDDDQFLRSKPAASTRTSVRDEEPSSDLDARAQDLEIDDADEQQFLRGAKRVAVRRSPLQKKTANRIKLGLIALSVLGVVLGAWVTVYNYGTRSWRFRIESSDNIEISGLRNVPRSQVTDVMGEDIGRNIFFVSLDERKKQLEQIAWVRSATVMRLLPNRIRVHVEERVPVAFVRLGSRIALIDSSGVVMEMPPTSQTKYSFPVAIGFGVNEPLSTRAARMRIFTRVMAELDSEGNNYSRDLSEVDLSDPDDVKVLASDPAGAVLVHLGDQNYLGRYKIYVAHVQEWRQQFNKLDSVDLRYDRQIIVNPDTQPQDVPAPAAGAAPGKP